MAGAKLICERSEPIPPTKIFKYPYHFSVVTKMVDEHNIKNSFRAVKGEILEIQGELLNIKEQQVKMIMKLEEIASKLKTRSIKKKTSKKRVSRKK